MTYKVIGETLKDSIKESNMITNEIYTCATSKLDEGHIIVIPKEICDKTGRCIGDILEFAYTDTGEIILRPYDPYRLIREKIRKADEVLQTLNNKIKIIVFDKNVEIYSSTQQATASINNYKITQVMKENYIDEIALESEILCLYPHGSLSVDQEQAIAIVIVNSMGREADTIIFDYLWKIIKGENRK